MNAKMQMYIHIQRHAQRIYSMFILLESVSSSMSMGVTSLDSRSMGTGAAAGAAAAGGAAADDTTIVRGVMVVMLEGGG